MHVYQIGDHPADLVLRQKGDAQRRDQQVSESQSYEESGRYVADEPAAGPKFLCGEGGADEPPQFPQQIRESERAGRRERNGEVEIELSRHRSVYQLKFGRTQVRCIDGRPCSEPCQQSVGREIGPQGAEQHTVDQKSFAQKSGDREQQNRSCTPHQVGPECIEMLADGHFGGRIFRMSGHRLFGIYSSVRAVSTFFAGFLAGRLAVFGAVEAVSFTVAFALVAGLFLRTGVLSAVFTAGFRPVFGVAGSSGFAAVETLFRRVETPVSAVASFLCDIRDGAFAVGPFRRAFGVRADVF